MLDSTHSTDTSMLNPVQTELDQVSPHDCFDQCISPSWECINQIVTGIFGRSPHQSLRCYADCNQHSCKFALT